ncbi:hypothetical protein CAOG_05815 [Capsaspora owczarzaki ATCC 30864]|nr:hypothetical protein CAOG_05815 [Capsaspora owczarzaki ATCC 30864]|eukprot:XP_004345405.1 hypothetical protein CAOG_05815 [Capsaspora owczarzaki ATCC 30864]
MSANHKSGWLLYRFGKGIIDASAPSPALQEVWVELKDDRLVAKKLTDKSGIVAAPASSGRASVVNDSDTRSVKVVKSATGLDFSIKGGSEHSLPILISRIFENGAAAKTGELHTGDTILEVNGVNLENATHEQAVAALKGVDRIAIIKVRFNSQASAHLGEQVDTKKKASAASAWSDAGAPDPTKLSEFHSVSLHNVIITRYAARTDNFVDNSVIIRAPDNITAIEIVGRNEEEINEWFNQLSRAVSNLHLHTLSLQSKNVPEPFSGKVKKAGFISQYVEGVWRYYFAVITDYDFSLYLTVPSTLSRPQKSYSLVDSRLFVVDEPSRRVDRKEWGIILYTATGYALHFAGESKEDRFAWVKALHSSTLRAARISESLIFEGNYHANEVALSLLWDDGLKLSKNIDGVLRGEVWKYKLSQLVASSHQGNKLVLVFAPSNGRSNETVTEEIEFANVRSVMHTLYNVLQAKVSELEPIISPAIQPKAAAIRA